MIAEKKDIAFNVDEIRKDFPILSRQVNGKPLIYFDSGATSQKPKQVIDSLVNYYQNTNANIHRGVHTLSQEATEKYESARTTVQKFINAKHSHEIIFTRGTTESINLVAETYLKNILNAGDEIIISAMEHHSNILPWQKLCDEKNAALKVIPIDDNGEIVFEEFEKLFSPKTKMVAITQVSNTLGTINPIKNIIQSAHKKNVPVMVDGAQAVPHMKVDVQDLDADFYCFSGHKMYAPTGIGVLYAKEKYLNQMQPYQVGGGVIKTVSFEKTEYAESPLKFEAGTPNIEGSIGLAASIDYINKIGFNSISKYEHELLVYATDKLSKIEGLKIIGTAKQKAGVISFVIDGLHPFDIGTILDKMGIAVRTGHHCTQPLMQRFGIQGTVRVSFGIYNTKNEMDELIKGIEKSIKMLR